MSKIENGLIGTDKWVGNYVPIVSNVINGVDLIEKAILECYKFAMKKRNPPESFEMNVERLEDLEINMERAPEDKGSEKVFKNRYFSYLDNKSAIRCAILTLVPVLSNIGFGIYDGVKYYQAKKAKESKLKEVLTLAAKYDAAMPERFEKGIKASNKKITIEKLEKKINGPLQQKEVEELLNGKTHPKGRSLGLNFHLRETKTLLEEFQRLTKDPNPALFGILGIEIKGDEAINHFWRNGVRRSDPVQGFPYTTESGNTGASYRYARDILISRVQNLELQKNAEPARVIAELKELDKELISTRRDWYLQFLNNLSDEQLIQEYNKCLKILVDKKVNLEEVFHPVEKASGPDQIDFEAVDILAAREVLFGRNDSKHQKIKDYCNDLRDLSAKDFFETWLKNLPLI